MKNLIGCLVAMMLISALVQMVDVQAATVLSTDEMGEITAGYCPKSYCAFGGSCGCPTWGCVGKIYCYGGTGRGQCKNTRDCSSGCWTKKITCFTLLTYELENCQGELLTTYVDKVNSCD